ncbi:MAG: hypothetical protein PHY16_01280 [Methylobacter sp.]|nr:hypothetical protein [Methylobacter sp.]
MTYTQIGMVVIFSVGMGFGQLLLKFAATKMPSVDTIDLMARLLSLFTNWPFILGTSLYGLLLIYWVWLLTFLPLSRAYPFTLLSMLVAAIGGRFLFDEPLTTSFIIGMTLIGGGLLVLSSG